MKLRLIIFLVLLGCGVEPEFDPVRKEIKEGQVPVGDLSEASFERGEYLYEIAACGFCHTGINASDLEKTAREIKSSHPGYRFLAESDLRSLLKYLFMTSGEGEVFLGKDKDYNPLPGVNPDVIGSYGPYLYQAVVSCYKCHGESVEVNGVEAEDLEESLENLSEQQVARFLSSGETPNRSVDSKNCAGIAPYSDSDLEALANYLAASY